MKLSGFRNVFYHGRSSDEWLPVFLFKSARFLLKNKKIYAQKNARIRGAKNISTDGELLVGMRFVGFMDSSDKTIINVRGKLHFKGDFSIGKGCRFDIGPDAVAQIGKDGYITANTIFIIMNGITIGDNCAISWNCMFLDDDFHQLEFDGKQERTDLKIEIGNKVWIGCNTTIYKGAKIPDGCVVAADSVVKTAFTEKNALIGGNPARIIKSDVRWS